MRIGSLCSVVSENAAQKIDRLLADQSKVLRADYQRGDGVGPSQSEVDPEHHQRANDLRQKDGQGGPRLRAVRAMNPSCNR